MWLKQVKKGIKKFAISKFFKLNLMIFEIEIFCDSVFTTWDSIQGFQIQLTALLFI